MISVNRRATRPGGILVATDLSRVSDEAVRQAHARALAQGRSLIVCFVIRSTVRYDPVLPGVRVEYEDGLPVTRRRAIEAVRAQIARSTGRAPADYEIVIGHGHPHTAIVRAARTREASLIVLGPHAGVEEPPAFVGNTVEQVLRHATAPVLVARAGEIKHSILVATDFSDPSMPALAAAVDEARRRDAKLTIVHSLDANIAMEESGGLPLGGAAVGLPLESFLSMREAAQSRLQVLLERTGLDGEVIVGEGSAVDEVLNAAKSVDAGMIFVGTRARTGIERVMLGSVAERIVRAASCSVFVVRLHVAESESSAAASSTEPAPSPPRDPAREAHAG
jgi:nucleotide-binding universal stress UspA family protein